MSFPWLTIVVKLMITVFLPRACDFCFVIHAETHITSKANPMENNIPGGGSSFISRTVLLGQNLRCTSFLFQCLHPMNWVNKAASVCTWEIQPWRKGWRIWALHLDSYQGSAGFVLKPLSYHVWMWDPCPPSCIYFCPPAMCVMVFWICTGEPFGSHSTLYFLSLSACLCFFIIFSL